MSIVSTDFLNFAKKSCSETNSEFENRNSASRAYYFAFHCCLSLKNYCPNITDDQIRGSHDKLYAKFEALPNDTQLNKNLKKLVYMAKIMKSVRELSDYRLSNNFSYDDAKQQLSDASKVNKIYDEITNS